MHINGFGCFISAYYCMGGIQYYYYWQPALKDSDGNEYVGG